jgi:uncharacterized membrane protein HdeD (DUF308 family)
MLAAYAHHWWLFAIRGIAAIVFGVLAFAVPALALWALVLMFGVYAIVDGSSMFVSLILGSRSEHRPGLEVAFIGLLGVVAGVIAIVWPGITALALLYVAAFWAIVVGLFQVTAAIRLNRELSGEIWLAIGGLISILFGLYLVIFPGPGLLSLVWLVGLWAMMFGISNLLLARRLWPYRGLPVPI